MKNENISKPFYQVYFQIVIVKPFYLAAKLGAGTSDLTNFSCNMAWTFFMIMIFQSLFHPKRNILFWECNIWSLAMTRYLLSHWTNLPWSTSWVSHRLLYDMGLYFHGRALNLNLFESLWWSKPLLILKYGFIALSKRMEIEYIENIRKDPEQSYPWKYNV